MIQDCRPSTRKPVEFALLDARPQNEKACGTPKPGPFDSIPQKDNVLASEAARAFATTALILYPVVATVVVVLVSLLFTGAGRSA